MQFIRTQRGGIINVAHILNIFIMSDGAIVAEMGTSYSSVVLYRNDDRQKLEEAMECLYKALTEGKSGFDFKEE